MKKGITLNIPVMMTDEARRTFHLGFAEGILLRITGSGRWKVHRKGQKTAGYWDRSWWRIRPWNGWQEWMDKLSKGVGV